MTDGENQAKRSFSYRPAMTAPEWAERVRCMENGRKYRFKFAPYQREMMETPFRKDVQLTVFQMASRLGKTEVCMNILGHAIDESPRRVLVMYPTTGQAEKWSKETFTKELCEQTPSLHYLVAGGKRQSHNTILHKVFPGGILNAFGGNAPGEMRRAKGNLLFADEIDALQETRKDEGDQLEVFWMRGSEYADCIRLAASYPSVIGQSRIQRHLDESDYRKWFTPCPRCKEWVVLLREHVTWPDGRPEEAVVECPECREQLTDKQRRAMVRKGEWRATKPFKGVAGFWGNAMMSPHPVQKGYTSHLHWLAQQQINAETSDNPERARRVLVNTIDALPHEPEMIDAPDPHVLMDRREPYNAREMLPEGVQILTAGVDVQKTWLELTLWGWGEGGEGWALDHRKFHGGYNNPKTWAELESYIVNCELPHPTRGTLTLTANRPKVFVDAGHWSDTVLEWTRTRSRLGIYGSQGSPTINAPVVKAKRRNAIPRAWVYPIGVNQGKEQVYNKLALAKPAAGEPPPPGYLHFPETADLTFFDSLTCEIGKEETFRGEVYTRYVCPPGRRNEVLDTTVYAWAALLARPVNWRREVAKGGKATASDAKTGTFSDQPQTKRPIQRRRWINNPGGWKI